MGGKCEEGEDTVELQETKNAGGTVTEQKSREEQEFRSDHRGLEGWKCWVWTQSAHV